MISKKKSDTKTRSLAFVSEPGDAVILVESITGYVLLESVVVYKYWLESYSSGGVK